MDPNAENPPPSARISEVDIDVETQVRLHLPLLRIALERFKLLTVLGECKPSSRSRPRCTDPDACSCFGTAIGQFDLPTSVRSEWRYWRERRSIGSDSGSSLELELE